MTYFFSAFKEVVDFFLIKTASIANATVIPPPISTNKETVMPAAMAAVLLAK